LEPVKCYAGGMLFTNSHSVSHDVSRRRFFSIGGAVALGVLASPIASPAAPAASPAASPAVPAPAAADPSTYLSALKREMQVQWPRNRIINLHYHGHSVPAGYFKTPVINTLAAYPLASLRLIKERYPFAQINVINTSIGGEHSVSGAKRFKRDVLPHRPDVVFFDYALNDRGLGLARARAAWARLITEAKAAKIKVILLTPTPDWTVNLADPNNVLEQHARQIRALAAEHGVGLVDSLAAFTERVKRGENVRDYLSQINHPNERGHAVVAELIAKWF
jgi:lysophospholipase L1-like esterase